MHITLSILHKLFYLILKQSSAQGSFSHFNEHAKTETEELKPLPKVTQLLREWSLVCDYGGIPPCPHSCLSTLTIKCIYWHLPNLV